MITPEEIHVAQGRFLRLATAERLLMEAVQGGPPDPLRARSQTRRLLRLVVGRSVTLPDLDPVPLELLVHGLTRTLTAAAGWIARIEPTIHRGVLEYRLRTPVQAGPLRRTTAHRAVWDYGRRLWDAMRQVEPELDARLYIRARERPQGFPGPRYRLRTAQDAPVARNSHALNLRLIVRHEPRIRQALANFLPCDFEDLIACLRNESGATLLLAPKDQAGGCPDPGVSGSPSVDTDPPKKDAAGPSRATTIRAPGPNDARDAFVYENYDKMTGKELRAALGKQEHWKPVKYDRQIQLIARRYASRHNLPVKEKSGRSPLHQVSSSEA
jgi:hypothetical protein